MKGESIVGALLLTLQVSGLVLACWAVLSVIFYGIKWALERAGLRNLPRRAFARARRAKPLGRVL